MAAGRIPLTKTPHLDTLEAGPAGPADATVILMHGLGASAYDFQDIHPLLGLPADLAVRYVLPQAPRIPVTVNMGLLMPAWYDVAGFDAAAEDERRIRASAGWIDELIAREAERGVPAGSVVLGGFSQGGALALFAGLRYPETLAGVVCLSGYLVLPAALEAEASRANRATPIFAAHGTADPIVPLPRAAAGRDLLAKAGFRVEWREYPMEHQVCAEEFADLGRWLTGVLA